MLCSDTDSQLEAVHFKNVDIRSMSKLEKIIQGFVDVCSGNGKVNIIVSGGKIRFFEPTSRVSVDDEEEKKQTRTKKLA